MINRVRVCSTGCAGEGGVCSGPGRPVRPRGEHAQARELHPALPQEATGSFASKHKTLTTSIKGLADGLWRRLQDLVNDGSEDVAGRGIAILRQLQAAGYLDDTEQDAMDQVRSIEQSTHARRVDDSLTRMCGCVVLVQVDEKLLDGTYKKDLRTEAMLFFTDHVEGFNTETSELLSRA